MSGQYGVTPEGFVKKPFEVILAEINGDMRADISQGLDLSPESRMGKINATRARQIAAAWDALEQCYNGNDPDKAVDYLLIALCKMTSTRQRAATKSEVPATVDLDAGTELVNGQHFAHVSGKPSVRFTPKQDYTAVADGPVSLIFEAENPGPVAVSAGALSVIATAVSGWNSVTSTADATLGRPADSPETLRLARAAQLAKVGSTTAKAIVADLHDLGQWLIYAKVFENESNITDADGRPGHSIEVLVYTEGAPDGADDQIAQVIWNNKFGVLAYGAGESGTAKNNEGEDVTVPFSRVTEVPIYLTLAFPTDEEYAGDDEFKAYLATAADARFDEPGLEVIALFVASLAFKFPGVTNITSLTLGTSPSPVGTGNIPIAVREMARFDTSRIMVA